MGVPIGDLLPRTKIQIEQIDSVAIDAFNAIYQFLSIIRQRDGTPLMDNAGRVTSHLSGLFYRTAYILSLIHISEPTRLLSISYAVFCLKKKKKKIKKK